MDLFDRSSPPAPPPPPQGDSHRNRPAAGGSPLADRQRPDSFEEFLGQDDVVGPGTPLRRAIERDRIPSLILWGPPGSGKTTLARIIAAHTRARFVVFSAVLSGVKEVRAIVEEAAHRLRASGQRTILFVDEIHRFNKGQQDAFLPHVEAGTIVLIGATTENPSFELNPALLSRAKVIVLKALETGHLERILGRAAAEATEGGAKRVDDDAIAYLADWAQGDARRALNALEVALDGAEVVDRAWAEEVAGRHVALYDKAGEAHYNIVSAFIKSLRGSDPDAALYWMARMLYAGEDPRFIFRRMLIFAGED
ncbi:MAG: replication-associated recombination protein A, partial [Myxococcales bacterium]|nr:replication-associated recombination protein A [Myxococcales bacterium]